MRNSSNRRTVQSPALEEFRRETLEALIEKMISLLDTLDGDENLEENGDLEPSIAGPVMVGSRGFECDLEFDNSDDEDDKDMWANPMGYRADVPEEARSMGRLFH